MIRHILPCPLLASLFFTLATFLAAEEVNLVPLMDATVSEANPDRTNPTGQLSVGRSSGQVLESYLRFDFDEIPAGATIHSATLRLQGVTHSVSQPVQIGKVEEAWAEASLSWSTRSTSQPLFETAFAKDDSTVDFVFPPTSLVYFEDVVNGVATDRGLRISVPQAGADEFFTFQSRDSDEVPRLIVEFTSPAAIPLFSRRVETEPLRTVLERSTEGAVEPWELLWNTRPGFRYRVWESNDLETWEVLPGFPREADSLSDSQLLPESPRVNSGNFFRVEMLDEQAPRIASQYPADEAFAIRRFYPSREELGILLADDTGIDRTTVSLTLSGRGSFTLDSPELNLVDGFLSFETGADVALGDYGETIDVSLSVADLVGNAATYDWTFVMEEQVVLVEDLLVFGSVEAQRSGQRLKHTPTRMLAGDPGPIRADAHGWSLIEVVADTLIIEYESSAPIFPVGEYLTNRTPRTVEEVFYRKVVSTNDDPENFRLTINTVDVPASEIMRAGSASLSGEELAFEVDEAGNIIAARAIRALEASGEFQVSPIVIDWSGKEVAGFYTQADNTTGMVLSLDLDDQAPGGTDWDGKLSLKQARLRCAPTLSVAAKTSFIKGVEKFYSKAELQVDAIIEPEFEFFSADLPGLDKKKTLWRHDFIIPIAGTPLWVTVTPRLNARAEFSAGLSGTFSVGASGGFTDTMIFDYVKDRDPALEFGREIGDFRFDLIEPTIALSGEVSASATIEPEIEVKLVSLVGF